ncbi:MAG: BirA family biotin operon repressor/biotin-[acetyl-CoA-carboxylase] ligase [Arenicella sp.]|jgi:BirA family biotin operon repressor/biotin-[acetyl-CoA-carboxylase] ligase
MLYKRLERNLIQLEVVDSTNNYAAELLKTSQVPNGTTILASHQQNGRGQRSAIWTVEANKNLTFSLIFFSALKIDKAFYLNIAASLAVYKTLSDLKIESKIKWPNDILVNGKKISGILIDNVLSGNEIQSSVIGIGLNVNQSNFGELQNVTSITKEIGQELDLIDVFDQLYGYLDFYLNLLMESNYSILLERYYEQLLGLNQEGLFESNGEEFTGIITGISILGLLSIQTHQGLREFDLKEIKMVYPSNFF